MHVNSQLKSAALNAYYHVTSPYRLAKRKTHVKTGTHPCVVLYYHRVADCDPVAWSLSNQQFQRHIDWLEQRYDLVSLAEIRRRMIQGNHRPCVHITFDDGYAENCEHAIPLLIERGIPCTYFVTLDNVINRRPFQHDQDLGLNFPVNSVAQLQDMAKSGIEIGAHTRTHPSLGALEGLSEIYDETVAATLELSDAIGQGIRYFAFPFGMPVNLNHAAAAMLKEQGIECVVSAYGGYNWIGEDIFHIQRVHGDPELARLRNAVEFDLRHVYRQKFELLTDGPEVEEAITFFKHQQA